MSGLEVIFLPFNMVITFLLMLLETVVGFVLFIIPDFLRSEKDVSNEIVLITGGGCGFGKLFALEFAKRGSTLVLWDINEQSAQTVATECKSLGVKAFAYKVDVSKSDQVYKVAAEVRKDVGDVTILVNNAGVVAGTKLLDTPDHLINRTIDVNLKSFFWTFKAFAPSILDNNHGHFVSIASLAGYFGSPKLVEYCASKFGVVGFEEAVFAEFDLATKSDVYSTIINPFFMNTGMFEGVESKTPLMPVLKPEEVMSKCMTAILTNQRYVFVPGSSRFLIYIKSFLPVRAIVMINKKFKSYNHMDGFVGRDKNN